MVVAKPIELSEGSTMPTDPHEAVHKELSNSLVRSATQLLLKKQSRGQDKEKIEQESTKKQKVDEDKDTTDLQSPMKVIPDEEEVTTDVVPLATKPPTIVDWKIHKERNNSYFQIIRADGSSKMYLVFSQLLKSVDKEDLVELYKLVKAKYGSTRPVEDMDLLLWGDLKTKFKPHVEDTVWRNQQNYKVLDWKLYDSCGVHSLRMQHVHIHMLVEKKYPVTPPIITNMLIISVKWHISFLNFSQNSLKINEVFGSILLVIMEILMEKLDDFGDKYQV
ncbi:hypothetical protein Tco_1050831 [Tanacetum coccineum]